MTRPLHLHACVGELKAGMLHSRLQLNDSETEVLVITIPNSACKHNLNDVVIGDSILKPTTVARYLGVKAKQGKFLYSAVSCPQDRSKRFTLYFPDRLVHSVIISVS